VAGNWRLIYQRKQAGGRPAGAQDPDHLPPLLRTPIASTPTSTSCSRCTGRAGESAREPSRAAGRPSIASSPPPRRSRDGCACGWPSPEGRRSPPGTGSGLLGVESFYQAGRDPRYDRFKVGAAILEHSIREAFQDRMREYRLLRGTRPASTATRHGRRPSRRWPWPTDRSAGAWLGRPTSSPGTRGDGGY
jgi:hypothetical protein